MNMSESEKSAYIRHNFVNNIFIWNFFNFFTGSKSASNSAFWIPILHFVKK